MSGNQEPRISLPTWRCSDFNAAIPIKKRKYFVQPQLPAMEEAASTLLEKNPQPNEQGDTSVGRSASSDAHVNQKLIGGSRKIVGVPIPSFADKQESIGNVVLDQIRVKVEEPNFPILSSTLPGFKIPSSSLHCSPGKLPVSAEHPGLGVTSDETAVKVEQTVCKTHDIVREIEEPTSLNLSLSKGVCAPHNTDSISTCTKPGNPSGVNRSNWDLNTTMDAWEDGLDRKTRVKTTGAFLNSNNRSFHDIETSGCRDEEKVILSAKELEEELYSYGFESDCGYDLSRVPKTQVGKRNLDDDGKVQRPAAIFAESNGHAECGGSETEQRDIAVPSHGNFQSSNHVEEKESQGQHLGNTGNKHFEECSATSSIDKLKKYTVDVSFSKSVDMSSTEEIKRLASEIQSGIFDGSGDNEGRIVQDGEQSSHQMIHANEVMSGLSTVSSGNVGNADIVDNSSPVSYEAEISTIDNDPPAEFGEGSPSRITNLAQASNKSPIKTLDTSDSFVPLRTEGDRSPDFPPEPRRYPLRGSDESCEFSRERYHGKIMRSPRLNFMPDKRRLSDKSESNLHDRDTKNFEFNNHGNTRRVGTFMSNRGRRPAYDEVTPFSQSYTRRTPSFSYTQRGSTNKEDASAFHGFRDGEKFTRGLQSNNTEPMFSQSRPYRGRNGFARGRNGFARGRTNFSNNTKRDSHGFRSQSPIRSRERSAGPSSSFRNRSQEEFSGHTHFSHRRSPSGYRMGRISSPDHSGYSRDPVVRRHNSPPYSHRPSNAGRGRGYARGRDYGRDGISFRKPYDRFAHRNQGNLNNLDPRERVDYSDDFFEGPIHSERFGVDVNVERKQFGYRHDGNRPSFNSDGCATPNVESGHDAVRFGQDPGIEIVEEGMIMETDGKEKNSTENASGRTKSMEEEETSKHSEICQQDELGGDGF